MNKILIIPYSRKLPGNIENPKNYPHWQNIVDLLITNNFKVQQLVFGTEEPVLNGVEALFNYTDEQQHKIVKEVDCWISVDTYWQHLAKYNNIPGIVIWTLSNPNIFGYPENMNLYSNEKYLIKGNDSYLNWIIISEKYKDVIKNMIHLEPEYIFNKINEFINTKK